MTIIYQGENMLDATPHPTPIAPFIVVDGVQYKVLKIDNVEVYIDNTTKGSTTIYIIHVE